MEASAEADAVSAWLRGLGLPELVETFKTGKFDDLDIVKELNKDDLDDLGIVGAGVRKKLLL
jgi:hypothetical protein